MIGRFVLLALACHAAPPPLAENAPLPAAETPLPAACARDFSTWQPEQEPRSFVSMDRAQAGRMMAPSLVEGVSRACACLARGEGEWAVHKLVVSAKPALGEASAAFRAVGEGKLAACVGAIETTFEGWPMPCSDAIDVHAPPPPDCAAILTAPVNVDFSAPL